MSTLREVGEFPFIDRVTKHLRSRPDVVVGPGDDCAVVRHGDRLLLVTCDLAMEDVHFRREKSSPGDIGWKVASAAISDIAAMGGAPLFVVSAVAALPDTDADELEAICAGIAEAAENAGAALVGGDVTRSSAGVILDVTALGEAPDGRYRTRSGAKPGDFFAVTGWPGRSGAGLDAQERGHDAPELLRAHHRPHPRVREGQWLAQYDVVRAMIDVSDGIVPDAGHLCDASRLGLAMTSASVAVDPLLADYCVRSGHSVQDFVFFGGEAYELAFAVDPGESGPLLDAFREKFKLPVTILGQFSDEFEGVLIDGLEPEQTGYRHFE